MNIQEVLTLLCGIQDPWKISNIELDQDEATIELTVSYNKGARFACPTCGGEVLYSVYDHAPERRWRHADLCAYKTIIVAKVPRIKCDKCGKVKVVEVPWANLSSRFTVLFETIAINILLSNMNKSRTAQILGISWDEIDAIEKKLLVED